MAVKSLRTTIYEQLSEVNIMKYGENYPIPQAIKSYWFFKHKIDCDKILSNLTESCDEDLIRIIQLCKNLIDLKLVKSYLDLELLEDIPETIATYCPKIRCLNLFGIDVRENQLLALCKCTKLEELVLRTIVDDKTLETLLCCLPNLYKLNIIDDEYRLNGSCLMKLPKILKHLELHLVRNIEEQILIKIVKKLHLECLHIHNEMNVSHNFIPALAKAAPDLSNLGLHMYLPHYTALTHFKQLKNLDLNCLLNIDNDDIKVITENCTLLTSLSLHAIPPSLTEGFVDIGKLPNLEHLYIAGHHHVYQRTYSGCMCGISRSSKLKTLHIEHCSLTNTMALAIVQRCLVLSKFTIVNCSTTIELVPQIATAFHNHTERTTKLSLTLKVAESGNLPPAGFRHTDHPLIDVTVIEMEVNEDQSSSVSDVDPTDDEEEEEY